jgi:hypothetical protein
MRQNSSVSSELTAKAARWRDASISSRVRAGSEIARDGIFGTCALPDAYVLEVGRRNRVTKSGSPGSGKYETDCNAVAGAVFQRQQQDEMRPAPLSEDCRDNWLVSCSHRRPDGGSFT